MKISATDTVLIAKDAGFEGNQLRIAVAVSFAEDPSHETAARGPKGEVGLWQIYLKAWPQFASQNLDDPFANARAAFEISQRQPKHWNYWSTWPLQAMAIMPAAEAAIATVESWSNGHFNDERVNLANKIALGDPNLHTSKLGNPADIRDIKDCGGGLTGLVSNEQDTGFPVLGPELGSNRGNSDRRHHRVDRGQHAHETVYGTGSQCRTSGSEGDSRR